MDVLSQGNNPSPFTANLFTNDNMTVETRQSHIITDNRNDENVFRLNPMLNDSLNNLVNRLERTNIPKQSPAKSHSVLTKSKLSNSLPNIFLPSTFDDYKCCNGEKKVQWTNKLNLNFERLKSAFRDTFNYWCQKRSQSIPNLKRNSEDNLLTYSSEFHINDKGSILAGKPESCTYSTSYNSPLKLDTSPHLNKSDEYRIVLAENTSNTVTSHDLSFSGHSYLTGAIIEPISPASVDQLSKAEGECSKTLINEKETNGPGTEVVIPIVRKRGRPRKIQQTQETVIKKEIKNQKAKEAIQSKKLLANQKEQTESVIDLNEKSSIKSSPLKPITIKRKKRIKTNENSDLKVMEEGCKEGGKFSEIISSPTVLHALETKVSSPIYSINQSNDIELLYKSISDTIMLPPRKRYKQLMYLDNNKQTSPELVSVIDSISIKERLETLTKKTFDQEMYETETKTNSVGKGKRKTQNKSSSNIGNDTTTVQAREVKEAISSTVTIDKPFSFIRSKREAAARGFANMVAMSLNSSSHSHEIASDLNKLSVSNKLGKVDKISSEHAGKNVLKKPRKPNTANSSFELKNEIDNIVSVIEKTKPFTKKIIMKNEVKANPPSPGETITSNDSSLPQTVQYRKIRTNTYVDSKPAHWAQEVVKCGCKPSTLKHLHEENEKSKSVTTENKKRLNRTSMIVWDCTDNCLNRLTYTECYPKTCPCGELCNNQKIRKLDWAKGLKITNIESKGSGVITTKRIAEGALITEYVGEVISEATFQDRMINLYREDAHHYCLHLDGEMLIDAYRSGSIARFVNHSCQPNCEMQKWLVNGAYRMCLFANEDISSDTELTYDYNFCSFNTENTQICQCGAANCRGFIGGRPRAEQSESQKDRKKLFYAFGRTLSGREKLFVLRRAIFLVRGRTLGRCKRLGIRRSKQAQGKKLPSTVTEIKRRKAKKNQFLTQMSALNSIRSIRTRLLQTARDNENLTRTAQLAQVLRDLYNTLLEQKDPQNPGHQLVASFINGLKQKKYPEFYRMTEKDSIVCLSQVYTRLLEGEYTTMMGFDQDILQMIHTIEVYAGKQSNIGKCAERMKPIYKDLKSNAIALFEALTDELVEEKDKTKLLSNSLQQITHAVKLQTNSVEVESNESKVKRRKQSSTSSARSRLDRGMEVIKCVCGFLIEAGHVMIQCDRCFVWQHSYCMNVARSAELVDVTRMEPYHCHICLNIPTESLVREIPRHFVISDETVDSGNTLFWTMLHSDASLLKIDDFVFIPSEENVANPDLSQRMIMRIYSLWKDANGQRWMEGGLFLRPYHTYLKSLSESRATNHDSTNKRKSASNFELSSHKWQQQEVVYTDMTRILSVDACIGRCHVLNNHTFKLGRPLTPTNGGPINEEFYLCEWFVNKTGEWREIDPTYLKINTKPYCFERFTDDVHAEDVTGINEKFLRQYSADDLLKFDHGTMDSSVAKNVKVKCGQSQDEKRMSKKQAFDKLLTKLAEFAYERTRKLPLSPPSSSGSQSTTSSRGTSPLCENAGSKSPIILHSEYFPHYPRKQLFPKKTGTKFNAEVSTSINRNPTSSDNFPQLLSTFDDNSSPNNEESSSTDGKSSSKPCSEIKYDDLVEMLKKTEKVKPTTVLKKVTTKCPSKKNVVPTVVRQTRSWTSHDNITADHNFDEGIVNDYNDESHNCFVQLERIRVNRAKKPGDNILEQSPEIVSRHKTAANDFSSIANISAN